VAALDCLICRFRLYGILTREHEKISAAPWEHQSTLNEFGVSLAVTAQLTREQSLVRKPKTPAYCLKYSCIYDYVLPSICHNLKGYQKALAEHLRQYAPMIPNRPAPMHPYLQIYASNPCQIALVLHASDLSVSHP
jgi:hypothetical protein